MKKFFNLTFSLFFFLFSYSTLSNAWTQSVIISPVRAVIEKKKNVNVKIINTSQQPASYKIEMISMEMDDKGSLYSPKKRNPHADKAIKMLKYSPRRVKLEPNGIQTIRIMARKPADLPEGEYRCHMRVTPLPPKNQTANEPQTKKETINVKINYLISTSIPVIIRHGNISKKIQIKQINYKNNKFFVSMEKTGKKSGLFNIEITQNARIIGKRERTAFYFPQKNLEVKVDLNTPLIKGQKIQVRLIDIESENKDILDSFSTII